MESDTHFQMNSFARRLIFIQRKTLSRKWPLAVD